MTKEEARMLTGGDLVEVNLYDEKGSPHKTLCMVVETPWSEVNIIELLIPCGEGYYNIRTDIKRVLFHGISD